MLPGVVAGGQRGGAEAVGEGEHGVQPHVAVAAHAGVGRQAGGVLGQPGLHHAGAELGAQVEAEVRQAHPVRDGARDAHCVGRAARALGVVLGVAPQLDGDGGRVRAAAQRGDGRVHPAAHGHQRALGVARCGAVGRRPRGPGRARARRRRARPRGACRGSVRPARRRWCACRRARRRGPTPRARARRPRCPRRWPRRSPTPRSRHRPRGRRRRRRRCARDRRTRRRRPRRHGRGCGRGQSGGADAPRSARRAPGQCRPGACVDQRPA